jgi:hypothetical protein
MTELERLLKELADLRRRVEVLEKHREVDAQLYEALYEWRMKEEDEWKTKPEPSRQRRAND